MTQLEELLKQKNTNKEKVLSLMENYLHVMIESAVGSVKSLLKSTMEKVSVVGQKKKKFPFSCRRILAFCVVKCLKLWNSGFH